MTGDVITLGVTWDFFMANVINKEAKYLLNKKKFALVTGEGAFSRPK